MMEGRLGDGLLSLLAGRRVLGAGRTDERRALPEMDWERDRARDVMKQKMLSNVMYVCLLKCSLRIKLDGSLSDQRGR